MHLERQGALIEASRYVGQIFICWCNDLAMRHALQLEPTSLELSLCCLTACCLAKTPTAALIARVGCGRGLLYAWVSLSHASLLVVGIRACKVMGETRFAGSLRWFSIVNYVWGYRAAI